MEVAKEASDIILMDDNFSSIISTWLAVSVITAVVIMFVTVVLNTKTSVLMAVQLLWINIIKNL